jgi:hypothetical protein
MPIIATEKTPKRLKYIAASVQAKPAREHKLGRSFTKDKIVGGGIGGSALLVVINIQVSKSQHLAY